MTTTGDAQDLPLCSCGKGPMLMLCAGPRALNPGRFYYRCPLNGCHPMSFIWCDQYNEVMSNARSAVFSCSSVGTGPLMESGARSRVHTINRLDDAADSSHNEVHSFRPAQLTGEPNNLAIVWCVGWFFVLFLVLVFVLLGVVVGMHL